MKYIKNKNIFFLLIPLLLVLLGISYGLPLHLVGDEESLLGGALTMLELKQIFPVLALDSFKLLYYPVVIPYLFIVSFLPLLILKLAFGGFDILVLKDYFILNLDGLWLSARFLTALFSVGVLVLVYNISKLVFSKRSAYLASILLATSFFHFSLAHFAKHWIFTAFFLYLVVYLSLAFAKGKIKKYWLIGLLSGLSLGVMYLNFFAPALAVIILYLYRKDIVKPFKIIFTNIILALVVGGTLVYLNLPDFTRFLYGGKYDAVREASQNTFSFWGHLQIVGQILFNQEILLLFLAILALFLYKRHIKTKIFIFIFLIVYISFLYFFAHFENRYLYFIIPALAILAADSLVYLYRKISNKKIYYILLAFVFVWPVLGIVNYTRLLMTADTRNLATEYIKENFKEQNFLIDSQYIYVDRNQSALSIAKEHGRINTRERYIDNNFDRLASDLSDLYDYQNLHFWSEEYKNVDALENYIQANDPSYFVLEYDKIEELDSYQAYLRQKGDLVTIFRQSNLSENYDINGNFQAFNSVLFQLYRLGPNIEIYKLK